MAYGNGVYVAVGTYASTYGVIMTSLDGANWSQVALPGISTNGGFYSVAFGQGVFLLAGAYGAAVSTNGFNWETQAGGPTGRVFICGDRFFASYFSSLLVSTNGGDYWGEVSLGINAVTTDVCFGNDLYALVGTSGTIMTSSNGLDWEVQNSGATNHLMGITYGQGKFIAVGVQGTILGSSDGTNWTPQSSSTTKELISVTSTGEKFVAVGEDRVILTSSNGTAWSISPSSSSGDALGGYFRSLAVGSNQVVTVGWSSTSAAIAFSSNGDTWSPVYGTLLGITYGNGLFLAVGEFGRVSISRNGRYWTNSGTGVGVLFWATAFGMGKYVTVGERGQISSSTNGVEWENQSVGTNTLRAIAFGTNIFVAVGDRQTLLISTNGNDWHTPAQIPFTWGDLTAVTYSDKGFVVGGFSDIGFSVDGENWTLANKPALQHQMQYRSAAYGKATYVMIAQWSTIVSSFDGMNWTSRYPQGGYGSNALSGVVFGNGLFVAVAYQGELFVSSDGIRWVKGSITSSLSPTEVIADVAYGNGSFIAIGTSGRIMQSGDIFSLNAGRWLPNSGLELNLTGRIGAAYQLQKSPDLVVWDDLFSVTNVSETISFLDASATNSIPRFYRARLPNFTPGE